MLRPVSVKRYVALLLARGLNAQDLVRGSSVDLVHLESPDCLIAEKDHLILVRNLIEATQDPAIGLKVMSGDPSTFGVLAYAGSACHTIRHGIEEVWRRYGRVFGVFPQISVEHETVDAAFIAMDLQGEIDAVRRFYIEEALCGLLQVGGVITGMPNAFTSLACAFPKPDYGDEYEAVFGCPVSFDAPRTLVSIPRYWLDVPLRTRDPELFGVCRERLERLLAQTSVHLSLSDRLKAKLSEDDGCTSMADAAEAMGMSSRTLTRRLKDEGASYRKVIEDVRKARALEILRPRNASVKETAFRLGFQDTASFRRAFKSWTGQTVSEYRANLQNAS